MVGHSHRDLIQKRLQKNIVSLPKSNVDLWSISHFLFFFVLAYINPTKLFELLIIGILWEIFEDYLSSRKTTQLVNCDETTSFLGEIWCNGSIDTDYWYGKHDDIMWNAMGIICGYYAFHKIHSI